MYVDQFYTSIPLALSLLDKGIYISGSFNRSCRGWPTDLKPDKKLMKKYDPVWQDSATVYNLTTCFDGNINQRKDLARRWVKNSSG